MIRKFKTQLNVVVIASLMMTLFIVMVAMRSVENSMEYALVGNESFGTTSKFELDLYSGHPYMDKAKELLWIDLASKDTKQITSGHYTITGKNANDRKPFEFIGSYTKGNDQSAIKYGNIDIEVDKDQLDVGYDLTLANGSKLKGHYKGKFQTADWRQ